jgi:SAM-dependent methyltransferase
VGSGTSAWPHLLANCGYGVTAIDNVRDYWTQGMPNRHWPVSNLDICNLNGFREQFDAITCISVIEHIQDHLAAVRNMRSLLRPGGIVLITCPYTHYEFCANVYAMPDAAIGKDLAYICRSYSAQEIEPWTGTGFQLRNRELWNCYSGRRWASGKKVPWAKADDETQKHDLKVFCISSKMSGSLHSGLQV